MVLFFLLFCFSFLVASKTVFQKNQHPSLNKSSYLGLIRNAFDTCENGSRNVVVDPKSLTQILQWEIGSITAVSAPQRCKTTMAMEYNGSWQYAATEILWKGQANLQSDTQASLLLSFSLDSNLVGGSILAWAISGPKASVWEENFKIETEHQVWSPCGKIMPFTFEWQVDISSSKKQRIRTGVLGGPIGSEGSLGLHIVTQWKECSS